MTMWHWLFGGLLVLHAHFTASYLVPLDAEAQREFGGLLRWIWPWSIGDSGLLGTVSVDLPLPGLLLAMTAATLFLLAALSVLNVRIPFGWWRMLAGGGAVLSLALMAGFFGSTKALPIALNLVVLWVAISDRIPPPE